MVKIEYAFQLLMIVCYALIKLSIVYFLRRLFVVGNRGWFNVITYALIVITTLWLVAFLGLFIFGCGSHIDDNWGNSASSSANCMDGFPPELAMASSDLILDILTFILPFPMVRFWKSRALS